MHAAIKAAPLRPSPSWLTEAAAAVSKSQGVLQQIKDPQVLQKVSFDTFQVPQSRKDEVRIVFDDYAKYISRRFDEKAQLLTDREVASTKCYICRRNLKRKIKWFTPNGKHYYSLSRCV